METRSGGQLTDFCLVLIPSEHAAKDASDAIRTRFEFLGDETREELVVAVVELVEKWLGRGLDEAIAVTVSLDEGVIHGDVSVQDDRLPFEIPLAPT